VASGQNMNDDRSDRVSKTGDRDKERLVRGIRRNDRLVIVVLIATAVAFAGILWVGSAKSGEATTLRNTAVQIPADSVSATRSSIFTTSHNSLYDAFKEYFGVQSTPVQPLAFNHKIHLQNGLECTTCHAGVAQGPDAGIPDATFCMACHQVIAAEKPEIKKLTAYAAKGQDAPWERVYWFYPETHVRFWHSPHIRAGVACDECHGKLSQQTVAVRAKNLTMSFCLSCHRAKGVSADCTTCHY
jgi:hypothetical protein